MRLRLVMPCIAIALLLGACGERTTGVGGPGLTLIPSNVALDLGKRQRFQTFVPLANVVWSLPEGVDGGYISASGMYYAPIRPRANPTVRVVATAGLSTAEWHGQLDLASRGPWRLPRRGTDLG
jgi:hypothetical protein